MISVVVPCYNEERNIHRLVKRFLPIAGKLSEKEFELVLVNNASYDGTSKIIDEEMGKYDFIKKVSLKKNLGYGYGILAGLSVCRGEWLGWIHADLQIPPEAFLEFEKIIRENPDKAKRFYFKGKRRGRPVSDTIFTIGMGVFESLYLGHRLWDINAQPTLIHKNFYKRFVNPPYDFSLDLYVYYLARKLGLKVVKVPVVQQKREEGVSSWNHGLKSRMLFIKRTLIFSRDLKKNIKGRP